MNGTKSIFIAAALLLINPALAQVTPISTNSNRVQVSFTGTVTNDVTNSIQIRLPNGTVTPYTGPVPEYPYKVGDQVSISFSVLAPNKNYYSSPAYTGQQAADGLYDITFLQPAFNPPDAFGVISSVDVTGPIRQEALPNTVAGLTLKYDANADTYSLVFANSGWTINGLDTPSYVYNSATGALVSSGTSCFGPACDGSGTIVRGNGTNASIGSGVAPTFLGAPPLSNRIGDVSEPGGIIGFFQSLNLAGGFNLPTFGSGGATQVPEPGMMLLFAGGVGALAARRRRAKKAA
jgi:hypothetical protein